MQNRARGFSDRITCYKSGVQEIADEQIPDSPIRDVVETISDYEAGFSLRFCKGPRPVLNWQAGLLETEHRNYRGPGMVEPFQANVSLFRLCGWGVTKSEAVAMAIGNLNGRNGG